MPTIGQMQPFDPANDQISMYLECSFKPNGRHKGCSVAVIRTIEQPAGSRQTFVVDQLTQVISEALRTKTGN